MKKQTITRLLIPFLFLIVARTEISASGFDEYLVARWTFENDSLESQIGDLAFQEGNFGMNPTISFGKDTILLGKGKALLCPDLNSSDFPKLREGATIWLRFRLIEEPIRTCFLAGFTDQNKPGDWPNLIFGISYYNEETEPDKGLRVQIYAEGEESPIVLGRAVPVRPGEDLTVAAIFDSKDQALVLVVNGQPFQKRHHTQLGELRDFINFGVGRLKEAGAAIMEIGEVRVYSTAISPDWLDEIESASSTQ